MLLGTLLGILVLACEEVKVPNNEGCVELTTGAGSCFWSLNGPDRYITPEANRLERIGKVCYLPKDIGEMRKALEKACEYVTCTVEQQNLLDKMAWQLENYHH